MPRNGRSLAEPTAAVTFSGVHAQLYALNIPPRQLEQRLAELPRKQESVAYCRGPYCVLSFEAVAALRAHGFNVRRFEDGFPEWKAAGLPIETAA